MNNKVLLDAFGDIDDKYILEAAPKNIRKSRKISWKRLAAAAACLALIASACIFSFPTIAEAVEYDRAVRFFKEYDMSTDGLSREDIKAVYRDITTRSFTYSRTAEAILGSISEDKLIGYEIDQDAPTSRDIENLWNYKNFTGQLAPTVSEGSVYKYRNEYKTDEHGAVVYDKSYVEKYDGEKKLWSVAVSDFIVEGYTEVSDGIIVYGERYGTSGEGSSRAYIAKISKRGRLKWQEQLLNGFRNERIAEVLEDPDGSYAVFSLGDYSRFCFTRLGNSGELMLSVKNKVSCGGIANAARLSDGYIVHLKGQKSEDKLVKVDTEGNAVKAFSYESNDTYYSITGMIEFNGNVYLSAYAIPKLDDDSSLREMELGSVLEYIDDNELWTTITSEELTPLLREKYEAVLMICDADTGIPREYYSVDECLGGKLSVSDDGMLFWSVESLVTSFYSPATNSFTFGGTCCVYKYTFDCTGLLIKREKTDELTDYRR